MTDHWLLLFSVTFLEFQSASTRTGVISSCLGELCLKIILIFCQNRHDFLGQPASPNQVGHDLHGFVRMFEKSREPGVGYRVGQSSFSSVIIFHPTLITDHLLLFRPSTLIPRYFSLINHILLSPYLTFFNLYKILLTFYV